MKTDNRNIWMIWAIVALALLNIATIVTVVYHRHQAVREEPASMNDGFRSENASIRYSGQYFRNQLNLTSEQMTLFADFNAVFRENARQINSDLNKLREKMLSEMTAEESDKDKLDKISDSIGYLHADLKKITYKYYFDLKNICDSQQKSMLEQMFSGMFVSDGPMGGQYGRGGQYGKGAQQGRRRGRQYDN